MTKLLQKGGQQRELRLVLFCLLERRTKTNLWLVWNVNQAPAASSRGRPAACGRREGALEARGWDRTDGEADLQEAPTPPSLLVSSQGRQQKGGTRGCDQIYISISAAHESGV